ncbi:hypothetical protein SDC9_136449 [bioreactor metagenome]|uniref:Uncharacterized protein n=1 Tax=bioreactor metagenome TaxID=1076179 RepID=A0A645DIN7_9ZZZZ
MRRPSGDAVRDLLPKQGVKILSVLPVLRQDLHPLEFRRRDDIPCLRLEILRGVHKTDGGILGLVLHGHRQRQEPLHFPLQLRKGSPGSRIVLQGLVRLPADIHQGGTHDLHVVHVSADPGRGIADVELQGLDVPVHLQRPGHRFSHGLDLLGEPEELLGVPVDIPGNGEGDPGFSRRRRNRSIPLVHSVP